jgi:hypothetical protein
MLLAENFGVRYLAIEQERLFTGFHIRHLLLGRGGVGAAFSG